MATTDEVAKNREQIAIVDKKLEVSMARTSDAAKVNKEEHQRILDAVEGIKKILVGNDGTSGMNMRLHVVEMKQKDFVEVKKARWAFVGTVFVGGVALITGVINAIVSAVASTGHGSP